MSTSLPSAYPKDTTALPKLVRTRSGSSFDPRADLWSYRDGVQTVYLDFSLLTGLTPPMRAALKTVLVWYAENRSAGHLTNLFGRMEHFLRFVRSTAGAQISAISIAEILSYRSSLNSSRQWYLGSLAGLLKKWHALGLSGVDRDVVLSLSELRLKGNKKGAAVLTMDVKYGPYTDVELSGIQAALHEAHATGKVTFPNYLIANLFILLGQRSAQYAALKVCDVSVGRNANGEAIYLLKMPRAKQRNVALRARFTDRILASQIGSMLLDHAARTEAKFSERLRDPSHAPLFPATIVRRTSPGFEYHHSSASLADVLRATLNALDVKSERTGRRIHVTPQRFRRTLATRAAEEGYGELIIAELLDHADTQNVGVYIEATPAIVDRIDRAVAMHMAPLAQAFAGVLIKDESEATRCHDPTSRIVDLRIDPTMRPMGSCGQHSFCNLLAPIACYTCRNFQPWLDGPHEAVLAHLLKQREQLLSVTSVRIASADDRTILAVAEVIRRCEMVLSGTVESQKKSVAKLEQFHG